MKIENSPPVKINITELQKLNYTQTHELLQLLNNISDDDSSLAPDIDLALLLMKVKIVLSNIFKSFKELNDIYQDSDDMLHLLIEEMKRK